MTKSIDDLKKHYNKNPFSKEFENEVEGMLTSVADKIQPKNREERLNNLCDLLLSYMQIK